MNPFQEAGERATQLGQKANRLVTNAKDAGAKAAEWSVNKAAEVYAEDERIRELRKNRPFTAKLAAPFEWGFKKVPLFGSALSIIEGATGRTILSFSPLTSTERVGRVAGAVSFIPFGRKAAEAWATRTLGMAYALRTGDHKTAAQEVFNAGTEITECLNDIRNRR